LSRAITGLVENAFTLIEYRFLFDPVIRFSGSVFHWEVIVLTIPRPLYRY